MLKSLRLTFTAIILATLCAGHANAGLITFNLAGDSGDGAEGAFLDGLFSGTVSKGGVAATISASLFDLGQGYVLNQTSSAFGINLLGDGCDNSAQIDNNCLQQESEFMVFQFSQLVNLVSLTLTSYSPSDDAVLTFENLTTESAFGTFDLPSTPSTLLIGAPVGGLGDRFGLASVAGNGFSIDRFTIQTVPTPATLALFGLGLLGLGWSRKKA